MQFIPGLGSSLSEVSTGSFVILFCCLYYSVCLEDPAQITAPCWKQAESISA